MAGINTILKSNKNKQVEQLKKDIENKNKKDTVTTTEISKIDDSDVEAPVVFDSNENSSKTSNANSKTKKRGRPTNAEKGKVTRKQYTLTLRKETYDFIKSRADEEGLSFASYMERAALEYDKNHN